MTYSFRPAGAADLTMLRRWLRTPEVIRWWGEPAGQAALLESDLSEPLMVMRIVSHDRRAFAYAQDYDVSSWPQARNTSRRRIHRAARHDRPWSWCGVPAPAGPAPNQRRRAARCDRSRHGECTRPQCLQKGRFRRTRTLRRRGWRDRAHDFSWLIGNTARSQQHRVHAHRGNSSASVDQRLSVNDLQKIALSRHTR